MDNRRLRRGRSDEQSIRSDKLDLGGRVVAIEPTVASDRFGPISRHVSERLRSPDMLAGPGPGDAAQPVRQELRGDRIGVLAKGARPDLGLDIWVPHVAVVTSLRSV